MKFEALSKGPFSGHFNDVLVPEFEFDFDLKPAFLRGREHRESLRDRFAERAPQDSVVDQSPVDTVAHPHRSDIPGPDQAADKMFELPEVAENALRGLETAVEHAPENVSKYARLFQAWSDIEAKSEETSNFPEGGGGAKPLAKKGRGDTADSGSTDGETTTVKGRGKEKNQPTDETNTDVPADTGGTTDPVGTTDTGGSIDTGGSTDTGETNTGTNDPNTYVSGLDTPDGYNIEIVFDGSWTDAQKQGFYNVSEKISDIITGDVVAHNGIDDVRISATMTSIDGSGGYWGWGGYSSTRPGSYLPSQGDMRFDEADADSIMGMGVWEDLVFHEMLHALGFGTAWNAMGLVEDFNGDLRFTGENAIEAYNEVYSGIASSDSMSAFGVAVETEGGSGTAGVHWDHATFGNEIMTGTLLSTNITSDMTVAALEDMGYETVYEFGDMIA